MWANRIYSVKDNMENSKKDQNDKVVEEIALVWRPSEDLPTMYANQMLISHSGPEFYLIFGEVITSAVSGDPFRETPVTELPVKPLVKIAITPTMMIEMANIISGNVEKFKETIKAAMEQRERTKNNDE
jgi:hypothetical protein